ncbi:VOC family protein [Microbacterium terricola]|uniref:Glyoxalase n=1 Tax=Microbacterium terricola TaxID=344163 RepID=A0ABM8E2W8_9MICO|nr:VOC family protein [Microbacterium terricola]UYK39997.1 VOC family protein [Microbacterium terricola]BDV32313.1 glyoxalase [Microbacterium terricola]
MPEHNRIDLIEFPIGGSGDLAAARAFYEAAFAWRFTDYGEYLDTSDSGVTAGFNAVDDGARQSAPLAVLYVDDLEAARERVTDAGGTIRHDIYAFPGGRRFHFVDPAGNELAVWSQ